MSNTVLFLRFFFYVDHFLKVFIEFVIILLLFYVFWPWGISNLSSPRGARIEPICPTLKGEVLDTGLPGKPQHCQYVRDLKVDAMSSPFNNMSPHLPEYMLRSSKGVLKAMMHGVHISENLILLSRECGLSIMHLKISPCDSTLQAIENQYFRQ